jgi:ABC-2 type transport system permease protein
MKKMLSVLKTEFINTFTRRSFLLTLILVPLVPALILGVVSLIGGDDDGGDGNIFQPEAPSQVPDGYIDQAGIIKEIPEWVGEDRLIEFTGESEARQAASEGDINGYYIIPADFIETGDIRFFSPDFSPLTALDSTWTITTSIEFNLVGADPKRLQVFQNPVQVTRINLAPEEEQRDESSPLAFYLPYGVTMLFYVLIITSASLMLNSVAKEKENRVMEILMSSIKPVQLLTGKILGLGLVGLIQMILWMGSALLMLRLGGTTLNIPPSLQLPPEILFWGIAFFILGYLIYATIMAGVGALVPNVKEASQATFYVILPILVPLLMIGVIIERPNATLPVVLSLIPFTAPNTIMTRMAVGPVPLWQLVTAIILMILTIILLIRAVAGMFRAQILLTGKKFSIGLYLRALMGKELETTEAMES